LGCDRAVRVPDVDSIAIFDLDGTLIPRPSAELRFAVKRVREGSLGPLGLLRWLACGIGELRNHGWHSWKRSKAYLAGADVAEVQSSAERFVHEVLVDLLRPSMLARLREHQAAGTEVLLLSGAPDFIARPLCARLGIAHCIAAQCDVRNGYFTALPARLHPFGAEKLSLARAFCEARRYPIEQAIAYGDSSDDAPLLQAVGRAVAVHPDARLEQLARSRCWDVVSWPTGS